jgi:hypothetical protein
MGQHGDRTDADVLDLPPVGVHLYVEDVDAVLAKATAAGSRVLVPIMDQPYGDREVRIADPVRDRVVPRDPPTGTEEVRVSRRARCSRARSTARAQNDATELRRIATTGRHGTTPRAPNPA